MSIRAIFSFLLLLLVFSFCERTGQRYLPPYNGQSGEVIVVMNDVYWDGEGGEAVREVLFSPVPGLANAEYAFTARQISEQKFGSLLKGHRNVLMVHIKNEEENQKTGFKIVRNRWSNGQLVLYFNAQNVDAFIRLFKENRAKVIRFLNQEEKKRLQDKFDHQCNVKVKAYLEKKHKISINMPKGFEVLADTSRPGHRFVWVRRNLERFLTGANGEGGNHPIIENLFIYTYPYTDSSTFTPDFQLKMRDVIGRLHVPGPGDGSYMATERYYLQPVTGEASLDSSYALQINGLWKLKNDFMGGPFVNVSVYDEKNQRIITMDGTVYAPKFNKREYIREMEAIIYSMKAL